MRFRRLGHVRSVRACSTAIILATTLAAAMPAMAHEDGPGAAPPAGAADVRPEWKGDHPHPPMQPAYGVDPRAREDWLTECRRRAAYRDDGVGGAVIGGLLGGFAGNRIAGRGHRTVGTVAGAAAGAVAGMAIDKGEDRGRARDECEVYLDDYYARYSSYGYGYPAAYGYGPATGCCYAQPMMMVPVMARRDPECSETVEYIEEPIRPRTRIIPRRAPDKRIRVAPNERIRTK